METLLDRTTDNIGKLKKELDENNSFFEVILYGQVYKNITKKEIQVKDDGIDLILPKIIVYLKKYECIYSGEWVITTETGKITIKKQ